jgi:multidrug efflux pump subunit AcrA (membrane-fusion protein)
MTNSSSTAPPNRQYRRSRDIPPWDAFVSAKNSNEFFSAWLSLICSQALSVRAGAILIEGADAQTYVPVAAWPDAVPDMARLGAAVQRALNERSSIVLPDETESVKFTHIAYPILAGERVGAVVTLDVGGADEQVQAALRLIHWGSAWLTNMFAQRELALANLGRERVSSVSEATAVALRHGDFQQALFEVANELRQRFACSRVAIGFVENSVAKVAALSEAATFEKNTPIVKAYIKAMEEAYDHGKPIVTSTLVRGEAAAQTHTQHLELLACSGDTDVLSFPLVQGARCIGVIVLEKTAEQGFDTTDVAWLDAFGALVTPLMEYRRAAERSALNRLVSETKNVLEKLFGPRQLVWKASASLAMAVVALMLLVHVDYRVTAKTVIEGEVQRVVAAPFDGFIAMSWVRAGDIVEKDQPLAKLEDHDLKIEQARWGSDRDQFDNRLREAMANHDMSAVQVIGAQLRQSQAQYALVSEKIERAQLKSPFAGVVVSGDLSQQIGSPVETGKKLFEVAPLQRYRVILQVDEREIRHVAAGQAGRIVMTGISEESFPVTIVKVTPVATAQDGKNFFRVEASLENHSQRLRPGMEGVGKVEVGSRRLWWILTHTFTDWLTLSLWTWTL